MEMSLWDQWVEEALSKLESLKLLRSLRPIHFHINEQSKPIDTQMKNASNYDEFEVFDGLRQWDRASVEVVIADSTFQRWVSEVLSCDTVNLIGFHFVFLCFLFLWVCFDLNEFCGFEFSTLTLFSFNVICRKIIW
ncbi:hypothetical protein HYC85_001384 [Camellia sinensis]|uniref:Uncharacterized protein n=1 Tax=Camellia sinensis TaxID=4442 RepID=A0A7J7I5V6_CAMSI|nr:hypothetical protein HYC85_001384 [Camellia sinensis]